MKSDKLKLLISLNVFDYINKKTKYCLGDWWEQGNSELKLTLALHVPLCLSIVSHKEFNIMSSSDPPYHPQYPGVEFLEPSYKPVQIFYTGNSGAYFS